MNCPQPWEMLFSCVKWSIHGTNPLSTERTCLIESFEHTLWRSRLSSSVCSQPLQKQFGECRGWHPCRRRMVTFTWKQRCFPFWVNTYGLNFPNDFFSIQLCTRRKLEKRLPKPQLYIKLIQINILILCFSFFVWETELLSIVCTQVVIYPRLLMQTAL